MIAPLDQFRTAVMADPALQQALAEIADPAAFVARATAIAAARTIPLTPDMLAAASQPDPLGIHRFAPAPLAGTAWPGRGWYPIGVGAADDPPWVDWAHFGGAALGDTFYEDATRQALARPFNRLFRYRTTLAAFIAGAPPAPPPTGLIFHMSRSGSTLTARMLAALPGVGVAVEPPPLDALLHLLIARPGLADPVVALRAMVAALGNDDLSRHIVKLDSWHALALPSFQQAFPETPWLFLCRDPVAVLASQLHQRGRQTEPGMLPPVFTGDPKLSPEDYIADVLARTCEAVVETWPAGGGLIVDYRDLPGAVEHHILPHFGIAPGSAAAFAAVAEQDAKVPDRPFTDPTRPVTAALRRAAAGPLADAYTSLQALATSPTSQSLTSASITR